MRAVRRIAGALVGLLLLAATVASAAGIAGSYSGRYQCGQWNTFNLEISEAGSGQISGVFTFSTPGQGGPGSYELTGQYDQRTGRFQLQPQRWIRRPTNYGMVGLEGTRDPASGRLTGKITYAGCTAFELAPPGAVLSPTPEPGTANAAAPERRRFVSNVTGWETLGFEYVDAAMADAAGTVREAEPIDDVIDWLKKSKFSCMGTRRVLWDASGTKGSASDQLLVRERYVIECDGNCRGVRYTPYIGATIFHFGLTQPVPVLEIKNVWAGTLPFRWDFTRLPSAQPPPDVYVHRWTSSGFNTSSGCRAPKANNK